MIVKHKFRELSKLIFYNGPRKSIVMAWLLLSLRFNPGLKAQGSVMSISSFMLITIPGMSIIEQ